MGAEETLKALQGEIKDLKSRLDFLETVVEAFGEGGGSFGTDDAFVIAGHQSIYIEADTVEIKANVLKLNARKLAGTSPLSGVTHGVDNLIRNQNNPLGRH